MRIEGSGERVCGRGQDAMGLKGRTPPGAVSGIFLCESGTSNSSCGFFLGSVQKPLGVGPGRGGNAGARRRRGGGGGGGVSVPFIGLSNFQEGGLGEEKGFPMCGGKKRLLRGTLRMTRRCRNTNRNINQRIIWGKMANLDGQDFMLNFINNVKF